MENRKCPLFTCASVLLLTLNAVALGQELKGLNQLAQTRQPEIDMLAEPCNPRHGMTLDLLDRKTQAIDIRNKQIGSVLLP